MRMMTPDQKEQVEYEIEFGRKAKTAYDLYVEDFLEAKNNELRNEFINCEADPDQLMHLKNLQMTLVELQTAIQSDIDTGQMASKMLGDLE